MERKSAPARQQHPRNENADPEPAAAPAPAPARSARGGDWAPALGARPCPSDVQCQHCHQDWVIYHSRRRRSGYLKRKSAMGVAVVASTRMDFFWLVPLELPMFIPGHQCFASGQLLRCVICRGVARKCKQWFSSHRGAGRKVGSCAHARNSRQKNPSS